MNEFIGMVSGRLNVSENTARLATGGLLGMIQDKVDEDDFGQLLRALSCSDDLVPAAPPTTDRVGMDSLAARVYFALHLDRLGSRTEVAGRLEDLGLESGQIGTLLPMFGQLIGSRVDGKLFQRIANRFPEIVEAAYDA